MLATAAIAADAASHWQGMCAGAAAPLVGGWRYAGVGVVANGASKTTATVAAAAAAAAALANANALRGAGALQADLVSLDQWPGKIKARRN